MTSFSVAVYLFGIQTVVSVFNPSPMTAKYRWNLDFHCPSLENIHGRPLRTGIAPGDVSS